MIDPALLDLYAHPPAGSRVLCLDEFGPLNRQPRLGRGWHPSKQPARLRATYNRTATTRRPAGCTVISARPRLAEVRELPRSLRARFDEHLIVVLDNFSPHLKTELRAWATEHDIELVYLPTYSSWLNLIECQFQALRRFALKGSDYRQPCRAGRRDPGLPALAQPHTRPAKPWRIKAEVHHSLPAIAA